MSVVFGADTAPPRPRDIVINSDDTYTNSRKVTLDIYAEDESAIEVWLSNDGVTGTIVDYKVNQTITITDASYKIGTALTSSNSTTSTNTDNVFRIVNWPITSEGDGEKKVYAVYNDAYGNTTTVENYSHITITYDLNGTKGINPGTKKTLKGLGVCVPKAIANDSSYVFIGWSNSSTADIANYSENDIATFDASTTLYAIFEEPEVGDFVDYGIEYTDVYTDYNYSRTQGWRLLSKEDNADGTSNIEIISTGVPAKFRYYWYRIDSATWVGDEDQRAQYAKDYYISSSVDNENVKAAAGLLYNFEKIEFSEAIGTPTYNKGYYTAISGSTQTDDNSGLFKASDISEEKMSVRSVMHSDIKPGSEKTELTTSTTLGDGLFNLCYLDIDKHGANLYYWLASPNSETTHFLRSVCNSLGTSGGVTDGSANNTYGVRPVVTITNIKLGYENGIWKIK